MKFKHALAEQAAVWGADAFYRDWQQDNGWCAVTDLDGNKRLELFFVRAVRNPVPHMNDKGSNEEKGRALVATVPITMRVRGFEVSADGKRLEELKFNYPDKIIPPNLTELREGFYNAGDKTRFYHQTIGTEYGNYGLFNDVPTAEAIFDYAEDRNGKKMQEKELSDYVKAYSAGASPADFNMRWIYSELWKKAQSTPGGVRKAFSENWKEFRWQLKKDAK